MNKKTSQTTFNEQHYPGSSVDAADGDAVSSRLERQYTRRLNNNPRNTDL